MSGELNETVSQARIVGALGYTSEILWHFFGRNRKTPEEKLQLLAAILDNQKLLVEPPKWKEYKVQVSATQQTAPMNQDDLPPSSASDIYFAEPKMVCLADIPIHCLPIHSQRYNKFAFGFSKAKLNQTYREKLRTVMLFTTDWAKASIAELNGALLRKRAETMVYEPSVEVAKFLKFESGILGDECFQNIYLEREWRCLEDVTLAPHLELLIVPRSSLERARDLIDEKLSANSKQVSVLAWESLYGEEGAP